MSKEEKLKKAAYPHVDFGERLGHLRKARGLRIDELAQLLNAKLEAHGHPPRRGSTIRGWEIGRHVPDAHVVEALKEILGAELFFTSVSANRGLIIDLQNVSFDWNWSIAETERYIGKYIEYRHSFKDNSLTTIWLEIFQEQTCAMGMQYIAKQKTGAGMEVCGRGIVMANDRNIYLLGCKNDTLDMEMAILLSIPMNQKFRFLHGIVLTTSYQRAMFAGKIVCEKIKDDGIWEDHSDLIGNFDIEELERSQESDSRNRAILEKFVEYRNRIINKTEEQQVLKIVL